MTDYYSIPALSASGINAFYKSPLHFWRESPFNPDRIVRAETPAMRFGKLCHALLLEEKAFEDNYAVLYSSFGKGSKKRSLEVQLELEGFQKENEGKTLITHEEFQQAQRLRDAAMRNNAVKALLGQGSAEKPLFWENGISCKAKLDYYRDGLILDYKTSTSASPRDFSKALVNFGYHRQAAWYMDGIERVLGERPRGFVFIVQEKDVPEAIGVYEIDGTALSFGQTENEEAIREISNRLDTGDWNAFPQSIELVGLPGWYRSKATGEVSYV